jgi:hypothetical protein
MGPHCGTDVKYTLWRYTWHLEIDLNNPHVLIEEEVWKLMVPDIFENVEEETLVVR